MKKKLHNLLSIPEIYLLLQRLAGASKARKICLFDYGEIQKGHRVLDVGCGPGYVRDLLPEVEYIGFDVEESYIDYARKHFGSNDEFRCEFLTPAILETLGKFDRIILMGVLHHLSDDDAISYLNMLKHSLNDGGKLITLDGVYIKSQSTLARWFLKNDRGQYVRDKNGYLDMAKNIFMRVEHDIRHDIFYIPYTSLIMTCSQ